MIIDLIVLGILNTAGNTVPDLGERLSNLKKIPSFNGSVFDELREHLRKSGLNLAEIRFNDIAAG